MKTDAYADSRGGVRVLRRAPAENLLVEWAPASLPIRPGLPHRALVSFAVLAPEASREESSRHRLAHLGFHAKATLAANRSQFASTFHLDPDSCEAVLAGHHDASTLPELGEHPTRALASASPLAASPLAPGPPLAPVVRGPHQATVAVIGPAPDIDGTLTVSTHSLHDARELVGMIAAQSRLPRWFRESLHAPSKFEIEARVDTSLRAGTGLPGDIRQRSEDRHQESARLLATRQITRLQLECLDGVVRAIQSGAWHISSGALRRRDTVTREAVIIASGLEPGDPPRRRGGNGVLRVAQQPITDLSAGHGTTMPRVAVDPRHDNALRVQDGTAQGSTTEPWLRARGRGLVWVEARFEEEVGVEAHVVGEDYGPTEVAETTLHELAAHCDLINQGRLRDSDHLRPQQESPADQRNDALQALLRPDRAPLRSRVFREKHRIRKELRREAVAPP